MSRCCIRTTIRLLSLLSLSHFVMGYSFQIASAPSQCGNVNLEIIDGQGTPPYSLLVVPSGPAPGSKELRKVFTHNFTDQNTSFLLPFPENSNFVMMLSDSKGFASGGTSQSTSVASSNDSSCLPNQTPQTQFSFQILPTNAINECQDTILAWSNDVQGDVSFYLLIPGGQSQPIPVGDVSSQQGSTKGFHWTPNVRTGTNIIIVVGDARGPGTGGSVNIAVGNNPQGDTSCINSKSPSSTSGTPAGAIETGTSKSNGSSTNVGAIAGGVIGGLAALIVLALLVWFILRKRKQAARRKAHDVDLLPEGQGPDGEFYAPEPFVIPSSSRAASRTNTNQGEDGLTSRPSMSDYGRRYSALSTTDNSESQITSTVPGALVPGAGSKTTTSRKSPGGPPMLRPVNVVQHEDGGEVPEASGSGEPETVELPPAYTSVKPKDVQV